MMPEETIRTVLDAAAPVTALVGDRIYPDRLPQGETLPAIVFKRAGTSPFMTLNDTLAASSARMRVQCWAPTRIVAEEIADAAMAALLAESIVPVGRDGFTDPETNEEASILDVEVWY